MGDTHVLSRKELPRPGLVRLALAGSIGNAEGADALGVSVRQFQRYKVRVLEGGELSLCHGNRGRPSNRRLDQKIQDAIEALMREKYRDLNDCHLTEKLREVEQILISRESVRRIRVGMGKPAKRKRKAPRHRARRLREASEGALVQIDGSPHNWFGEDRPPATLVGGIDDATGNVLAATFRPHEDLHGYATIFAQIFEKYGLPLSSYGDGTSILVRNDEYWTLEEELQGRQFPTHMGQVLVDLGIGYIKAGSPQAKGRIESLWGTFQDRLTAELALRGITTIEEANAFLPEFIEDYNRRFAREAREAPVWRKPNPGWRTILSCRYSRKVARDNTVQLPAGRSEDKHRLLPDQTRGESSPTRIIKIPPGPGGRSYAGCSVEVREYLDGRATVHYREKVIAAEPSPPTPFRLMGRPTTRRAKPRAASRKPVPKKPEPKPVRSRKSSIPGPDHPWRRYKTTTTTRTGG